MRLARPLPLVVPVLRAGLGMLDGMTRLLPTAEVGFLGMVRDETSLAATTYADRLPEDLSGREVFVLDPMLATGGTLVTTIELSSPAAPSASRRSACSPRPRGSPGSRPPSRRRGCRHGRHGRRRRPAHERGYITPGLGDAGDRLYGVV